MFLSVILPSYNEEKRLPETLKKVRDYLEKQKYEYEVIVVDDGSTDQTKEVVNNIAARWKSLQILSYQPNKGKGYAVKMGMLSGKGDWRLLMDADNSTDLSQLDKFWKFTKLISNSKFQISNQFQNSKLNNLELNENLKLKIENSYDIIIGSRYLNKDSIKIKQPLIRRMGSRFGNILIRATLGLNFADTQCGFKMYSSKAAQEIFSKLQIDRWGFDMESLAIAKLKGYKIKEVAIDWYDATGSTVAKVQAIKTLKDLWQIKRNIWAKKY